MRGLSRALRTVAESGGIGNAAKIACAVATFTAGRRAEGLRAVHAPVGTVLVQEFAHRTDKTFEYDSLSILPGDRRFLAADTMGHGLAVFSLRNGRQAGPNFDVKKHGRRQILQVVAANSGTGALVQSSDMNSATPGRVSLWNVAKRSPVRRISTHTVSDLAASPNGRGVAWLSLNRVTLFRWGKPDKIFREPLVPALPPSRQLMHAALAPGGGTIAVGIGKAIRLYNTANGRLLGVLQMERGDIYCFKFDATGRLCGGAPQAFWGADVAANPRLAWWHSVPRGECTALSAGRGPTGFAATFMMVGHRSVFPHFRARVRAVDWRTGKSALIAADVPCAPRAAVVTPSGRMLLLAGYGGIFGFNLRRDSHGAAPAPARIPAVGPAAIVYKVQAALRAGVTKNCPWLLRARKILTGPRSHETAATQRSHAVRMQIGGHLFFFPHGWRVVMVRPVLSHFGPWGRALTVGYRSHGKSIIRRFQVAVRSPQSAAARHQYLSEMARIQSIYDFAGNWQRMPADVHAIKMRGLGDAPLILIASSPYYSTGFTARTFPTGPHRGAMQWWRAAALPARTQWIFRALARAGLTRRQGATAVAAAVKRLASIPARAALARSIGGAGKLKRRSVDDCVASAILMNAFAPEGAHAQVAWFARQSVVLIGKNLSRLFAGAARVPWGHRRLRILRFDRRGLELDAIKMSVERTTSAASAWGAVRLLENQCANAGAGGQPGG